MIRILGAVISMAILASPPPLEAREKNGITMDDTLELGGKKLVLNGLGVRKAYGVVKVYVGGLYLETATKDSSQILASPELKQIRLQFLMDVAKEKLTDAWLEGFKKNCSEKCDENKKPLDALVAQMSNMKTKDLLIFSIFPDRVEVTVRADKKEPIPGSTFARTMLAVFIGNSPPNAALKEGMLGID